jgi:hypothetical protein
MSRKIKKRIYSGRRQSTLVLEWLERRVVPSMTALTPSVDPSTYLSGQTVTVTATVTPTTSSETGAPSGAVNFQVDQAIPVEEPLVAITGTNSAQATFPEPAQSVGAHSITASYPGDGNFSASSTSFTQTVLPSGTATGFAGAKLQNEPTPFWPPDSMGAVGPNNLVETLNGYFAVYDKSGKQDMVHSGSLDSFWASVLINNTTVHDGDAIDPRIVYDKHSGHWFISSIDQPPTKDDNDLLLAVSKTSDPVAPNSTTFDPSQAWLFYKFRPTIINTGRAFGDYDTLGVDDNGVYFGLTVFDVPTQTSSAEILAIYKPYLLSLPPPAPVAVASITAAVGSTAATVTISAATSFVTGQTVVISGATPSEYNTPDGAVITVTSSTPNSTTFTYTLPALSTATPATGTITATTVITPTLTRFSGITDLYASPQPAMNFDNVAATDPAWFVGSISRVASTVPSTLEGVAYRTLTWSGNTPSLSGPNTIITTPAYFAPVAAQVPAPFTAPAIYSAPSPGSSVPINATDDRLLMAIIRHGQLWTARTVGLDSSGKAINTFDRNGAEFLELDVSTTTASLIQSGRVFDPSTTNPRSYYFPSVMVNEAGYMVMGFSGSSSTEFVGAYATSRFPSDPLNPVASLPVTLLKAGEAPYEVPYLLTPDGPTVSRWGDYSYTSLDPTDDMTIWTVQEFAEATMPAGSPPDGTTSRWDTWISRVQPAVSMAVLDTPSPDQFKYGQTLTVTAFVRDLAPNSPVATGSVTFMDNKAGHWDVPTDPSATTTVITDLTNGKDHTDLSGAQVTDLFANELVISPAFAPGTRIQSITNPGLANMSITLNSRAMAHSGQFTLIGITLTEPMGNKRKLTMPLGVTKLDAHGLLVGQKVTDSAGAIPSNTFIDAIIWNDPMNSGRTTLNLTHMVNANLTNVDQLTFWGSSLAFSFGPGVSLNGSVVMDGVTVPTATLVNPTSSSTTPALTVGHHAITAAYDGFVNGGNFPASPALFPAYWQTVMASSLAHVGSPTPSSTFGQTVTFTASVAALNSSDGTPTGTVTFEEGTVTLAASVVLDDSGVATFSTSALSVGSHTITAVYSGDIDFADCIGDNSASPQVVQATSSTTVTSSPNGSVFGQAVTFTATVGAGPGGPGTPTGTVSFSEGSTILASGVALAGGQATFSTAALSVASHTITASYGGSASFLSSSGSDSAAPQVVNKANSNTALSSTSTSNALSFVTGPANGGGGGDGGGGGHHTTTTFTAVVTAVAPGAGTPSGSVTFLDNGASLGTRTLDATGTATLTTILVQPGDTITATYAGDSHFNSSASPNLINAALSNQGSAYAPADVRSAYGLNQVPLDGGGQTIAIVDAYDNPAIYQSLDAFDAQFGLTAAGPASSFLSVLNQRGQASALPSADPIGAGYANWEMESALDVEWVHAMAPGAHIILVEADSQSLSDLMAGAATATRQPGVSVVSMSWGFPEGQAVLAQDEATYDSYFTTPGVTFVASTGDYGTADPEYPAYSPNVIAVGGTSLYINAGGAYGSESGWGYSVQGMFIGSGGGLSQFETEPAYQQGVQSTGNRTTPDVAFVADPGTGGWIADLYNRAVSDPFEVVGGTSLAAPSWAGIVALVNQGRTAAGQANLNSTSPTETQQDLYRLGQSDYHVIASGTNGGYNAAPGYNLVTGLGTPIGNLLVADMVAGNYPATGQVAPVSSTLNANAGFSGSGGGTFNVFNVRSPLSVVSGTGHLSVVGGPLSVGGGAGMGMEEEGSRMQAADEKGSEILLGTSWAHDMDGLLLEFEGVGAGDETPSDRAVADGYFGGEQQHSSPSLLFGDLADSFLEYRSALRTVLDDWGVEQVV